MPETATLEIGIHLQTIEDLFVDPDTNPFENPNLRLSGMQTILNELDVRHLKPPMTLTIYLPTEQITPGLLDRTKEALKRYCKFQAENQDIEVRSTRMGGRRSLASGLIGATISVILAGFGYFLASRYGYSALGILGTMLGSFFMLTAWVVIWTPVDTLIYYWRPAWHEARKYRLIAKADVRILPEK